MILSRFSSGGGLSKGWRTWLSDYISTHPCYDIWLRRPHHGDYLGRRRKRKLSLNLNNASIDQKLRARNVHDGPSPVVSIPFFREIINVNVSGILHGVSNNNIPHDFLSNIFSNNFHGFLCSTRVWNFLSLHAFTYLAELDLNFFWCSMGRR